MKPPARSRDPVFQELVERCKASGSIPPALPPAAIDCTDPLKDRMQFAAVIGELCELPPFLLEAYPVPEPDPEVPLELARELVYQALRCEVGDRQLE